MRFPGGLPGLLAVGEGGLQARVTGDDVEGVGVEDELGRMGDCRVDQRPCGVRLPQPGADGEGGDAGFGEEFGGAAEHQRHAAERLKARIYLNEPPRDKQQDASRKGKGCRQPQDGCRRGLPLK